MNSTTCQVLEQRLGKADHEERNEAFFEARVEYLNGRLEELVFDRKYGLGRKRSRCSIGWNPRD